MGKATRIELLLIDPQNDFCDPDKGSLYVPGAEKDMERVATLIGRLGMHLDDIHVTMDSHQEVDVSHPMWFKDSAGNHPDPFSLITADNLETGVWTTSLPGLYTRTLQYLQALTAGGRYTHTIWPYHCVIGTQGHALFPAITEALHEWKVNRFATVDFVTKGSNPFTEHFSAVKAEVPDPSDPTTQINTGLITTLRDADIILLAGEAETHCCKVTIEDIVDEFGDPDLIKKMVWLEDAMSPVPDPPGLDGLFSNAAAKAKTELKAKGMQFTTCADFLA
jgi:nicotinamidase/pyrazinamidase